MFLSERLNHWASSTPDAAAVVFENREISFARLKARVDDTASLLANTFNVQHGDRVAYLGLNHPDVLVIFFACAKLGAIFNPLNSRLARQEYDYLLDDAQPAICIVDPEFGPLSRQLQTGECQMVSLDVLQDTPRNVDVVAADVDADDALLLVYTSGTTALPKGVLLSHLAVQTNIDNCNALYNFGPGQKVQVSLPLFHVGGLCILLLPALVHGATIFLHRRFDPVSVLAEIELRQINTSIFVPAQMAAMMSSADWHSRNLYSLDYVVVGSSIIPMDQIQAFHRHNIPVSQIYGATETGPAAIGLAIGDAMDREGSAGKPVKHCDIEVRSPDGDICLTNERGELWVRGTNILSGYWRNKTETAKVLVGGWYNTGDIGFVDDQGYYRIVDRSRDVIISGGENIYPAEVEAALMLHPSIAAVAVVGCCDPHWGEVPVAATELRSDMQKPKLDEIRVFLEHRLARYKHPKAVYWFDELPRNSMGKIEKSALRAKLAAS